MKEEVVSIGDGIFEALAVHDLAVTLRDISGQIKRSEKDVGSETNVRDDGCRKCFAAIITDISVYKSRYSENSCKSIKHVLSS